MVCSNKWFSLGIGGRIVVLSAVNKSAGLAFKVAWMRSLATVASTGSLHKTPSATLSTNYRCRTTQVLVTALDMRDDKSRVILSPDATVEQSHPREKRADPPPPPRAAGSRGVPRSGRFRCEVSRNASRSADASHSHVMQDLPSKATAAVFALTKRRPLSAFVLARALSW